MLNRIFVYDDLLLPRIQKILKINPINEVFAEATGKLYMMYRQPIMLNTNDVAVNKGFSRVLGAILEFDEDQMEKVIYTLDNYKSNSVSRIGLQNPNDFTYRTIIPVNPIVFKTLEQLQEFKYEYKRAIDCYAYLGNPNNPYIIYNIKVNKHTKISDGVHKRSFKTLLSKKGYLT